MSPQHPPVRPPLSYRRTQGQAAPAAPPGCPVRPAVPEEGMPLVLHGEEFTRDPGPTYDRARAAGAPVVRAELDHGVEVSLVISYHTAVKILHHPEFSKDSRPWFAWREEQGLPDSPVLTMLDHRTNCLYMDGDEHRRLNDAVRDSLSRLDAYALREAVRATANALIDTFAEKGTADLLGSYAKQVSLRMFTQMFGAPPELGERIVLRTAQVFDGGPDAESAYADMLGAFRELIALKHAEPGRDVLSWLIDHHAEQTDEELAHQLLVVMGAGTEPEQHLIATTLLQLLTDAESFDRVLSGRQRIADALETTLLDCPPMANYATHYPRCDIEIDGVLLEAGKPVMISFAAVNRDTVLRGGDPTAGNRAHLAWSAGPHECPSQDIAVMMATVAVEELLYRLPDVELAVPREEVTWRPGPYQRGLQALPVRFAPRPVRSTAARSPAGAEGETASWKTESPGGPQSRRLPEGRESAASPAEPPHRRELVPVPTNSTRAEATYTPRPRTSVLAVPPRVWRSLVAWWHGR